MLLSPPSEAPKKMRSRFSKALPSVPPLENDAPPSAPPKKDLPMLPASQLSRQRQPVFRPRGDSLNAAARAVGSPSNPSSPATFSLFPSTTVSPPAPKTPASAPVSKPLPMAVPRKPVARKPVPAPAAPTPSASVAAPSPAPAPVSPPASTPASTVSKPISIESSKRTPVQTVTSTWFQSQPSNRAVPQTTTQESIKPLPSLLPVPPPKKDEPPRLPEMNFGDQSPPSPPAKKSTPPQAESKIETKVATYPTKEIPVPQAPWSPTESLSSLLSAYSRSSEESKEVDMLRSSGGTASMRESDVITSPAPEQSVLDAKVIAASPTSMLAKKELPQIQSVTRKPVQDRSLPPPPPPVKDQQPTENSTAPQIATSSPPRQQIWRRRSFKGSRDLPDLKLDYSHGSTAATQSAALTQPPSQIAATRSDSASHTSAASTSTITALDSRPPPPPAKGPADAHTMGNKSSKEKLASSLRSERSPSSTIRERTIGPVANRPPTPEYQKEDIKTPIPETYISPVSPASSPEPSRRSGSSTRKQLPPQPTASQMEELHSEPQAARNIPPSLTKELPAPKQQQPDLKITIPISTRQPPVPVHGSETPRTASPSFDSSSMRLRNSGDSSRFPPREASMRADSLRNVAQLRSSADTDPRLVWSESHGSLYRGRDGTLYPEMVVSQEPEAKALRFPTQSAEPIPDGAILRAVPLKNSHFKCFAKHRVMKRISNKRSPLTCQTCEREDTEDRWACTFCHLRVCESCTRALEGYNKDLEHLVNDLNNHTALSLSSPARSGSALGLQLPSDITQ